MKCITRNKILVYNTALISALLLQRVQQECLWIAWASILKGAEEKVTDPEEI